MNLLFDALFAPHMRSDHDFLILPDDTRISFADFVARSGQLANAITELGVAVGDRVAVQVSKTPDALALYAACVRAGAVFLPLNTAYTPTEVSYFLNDSGAALFVCDPDQAEALRPICDGPKLATLGAGSDLSTLADSASPDFTPVPREAADLAAILYTSGTTGRSKGAMLSHRNLLSNAQTLQDLWRFTDDDVLLHALPIFHTHGLFVGTNICLLAGASMVFLPKFDTNQVIRALPTATSMMGVPTFYTRLLADEGFDQDLTQNMRLFISGSAPLLAETHRQFQARTGHKILERYGMTETNMNTSNPYDGDRRAGTVGHPLPDVELRVCDAHGQEIPRGEIGTIEVRGPNVFRGYWQMPEKTAEELRPNGFFITGDLATQDEDGYVTIVGRAKDMIISGGFNVYPKEVEDVIDALPGVTESAVIGVPHPDFGEAVVAVIVGDAAAGDLQSQIATSLAAYKRPKHIVSLPELPRNTMGKVQKAALRREYAELFGKDD